MDIFYLIAAVVVLGFGAWIAHSGLRRWQRRGEPATPATEAETSPTTDFRYRPHLETGFGLLMIGWALRLIVLFVLQVFAPKAGTVTQDPTTGRVENLPTPSGARVEGVVPSTR